MVSAFQREAIRKLIQRADLLGVPVPQQVRELTSLDHNYSYPAAVWANTHPGEDRVPCCDGSANRDEYSCTCWQPVYLHTQAPPRPPERPEDIKVAPTMCGDCAYRRGSPERSEEYEEEHLMDLAASGTPFWCHQGGMRRPDHWRHPDGRVVPGSPADWQPPRINGVPFLLDGRPAMLCAGWAHRAARAAVQREERCA